MKGWLFFVVVDCYFWCFCRSSLTPHFINTLFNIFTPLPITTTEEPDKNRRPPRQINTQRPTKAAHCHTDTSEADNNHPVLNRFVKISAETPRRRHGNGPRAHRPRPLASHWPQHSITIIRLYLHPLVLIAPRTSRRPARGCSSPRRTGLNDWSVRPSVCLSERKAN